jgi:hypothetical protein
MMPITALSCLTDRYALLGETVAQALTTQASPNGAVNGFTWNALCPSGPAIPVNDTDEAAIEWWTTPLVNEDESYTVDLISDEVDLHHALLTGGVARDRLLDMVDNAGEDLEWLTGAVDDEDDGAPPDVFTLFSLADADEADAEEAIAHGNDGAAAALIKRAITEKTAAAHEFHLMGATSAVISLTTNESGDVADLRLDNTGMAAITSLDFSLTPLAANDYHLSNDGSTSAADCTFSHRGFVCLGREFSIAPRSIATLSFGYGDATDNSHARAALSGTVILNGLTNEPHSVTATSTQTTSATPTYTCGPLSAERKLFDNWNDGVVSGGGSAPTFSTDGSPFCLIAIEDYHYNNHAGSAPGSIGLTASTPSTSGSLGPFPAVGSGVGAAANEDWTATPPSGAIEILDGTYRCMDSDPATWSEDAESNGLGFCDVEVVPATTTGAVTATSSPAASTSGASSGAAASTSAATVNGWISTLDSIIAMQTTAAKQLSSTGRASVDLDTASADAVALQKDVLAMSSLFTSVHLSADTIASELATTDSDDYIAYIDNLSGKASAAITLVHGAAAVTATELSELEQLASLLR